MSGVVTIFWAKDLCLEFVVSCWMNLVSREPSHPHLCPFHIRSYTPSAHGQRSLRCSHLPVVLGWSIKEDGTLSLFHRRSSENAVEVWQESRLQSCNFHFRREVWSSDLVDKLSWSSRKICCRVLCKRGVLDKNPAAIWHSWGRKSICINILWNRVLAAWF